MSLEKCIDLLLTRRSIRKFEPKEVSEDLLIKILDGLQVLGICSLGST